MLKGSNSFCVSGDRAAVPEAACGGDQEVIHEHEGEPALQERRLELVRGHQAAHQQERGQKAQDTLLHQVYGEQNIIEQECFFCRSATFLVFQILDYVQWATGVDFVMIWPSNAPFVGY